MAKLTSVPAARLGLRDRGVVREGAFADLVVFDPATVADEATYLEPARYPLGIEHVIVNGRPAILDGPETGRAAGSPPATGRVTRDADVRRPRRRRDAGGRASPGRARSPYTLRRSPRARALRVVIHPDRGVVVTVPPATRRGAGPTRSATSQAFLAEREPWLRRHLARQARRPGRARPPGAASRDGAADPLPRRPAPAADRAGAAGRPPVARGAGRRRATRTS